MEIEFNLCEDTFLLGIEFLDCIAEDMNTRELFETQTLSFGFLFFTIDIHFKPKSN